jgi:hypothetical protein
VFAPFAEDHAGALRWWFVAERARGSGDVLAAGELEPRMIDPDSGEMYAPGEIEGEKALRLKAVWERPRAGQEPQFLPGALRIALEDPE